MRAYVSFALDAPDNCLQLVQVIMDLGWVKQLPLPLTQTLLVEHIILFTVQIVLVLP